MTEIEFVRLRIHDPAGADQLYTDEQIEAFLNLYPDEDSNIRVLLASADLLDSTGASFSSDTTTRIKVDGQFEVERSSRSSYYNNLALLLRGLAYNTPVQDFIEINQGADSAEDILLNNLRRSGQY